jgi:hypothetical protein
MKKWWVNDDLKIIWKETIVTQFEGTILAIVLGTEVKLENRRIVGLHSEIWTRNFPNRKQEC